jgi:hypothetical protein
MSVARFIIVLLLSLTLAAFSAQFFIDFSSINIATSCIVLISAFVLFSYVSWTKAIQTHPLSTFAIFGFGITTQIGALLAQSAAWTAVSGGLRQPIETFATLLAYLIVALIAHSFFRVLSNAKNTQRTLVYKLLEKSGLYNIPRSSYLWMMGLIGLFGFLLAGGEDVGNKVSAGFKFLTWAPFLIPIYLNLVGTSYCNVKKNYFLLIGWTLLLVALALVMNTRAIMFTGLVTVGLIYLLMSLRNNNILQGKQIFKLSALLVIFLAVAAPISDLAIAMQVARKDRQTATAKEMMENTFKIAQKQYLIEQYKNQEVVAAIYSKYDEAYISNPIVKRFVETKFHDNALYFSSKLSISSKDNLEKITIEWLLAILPQPLLDVMKIDIDKQKLRFSAGDYLAYEESGIELGGYRTGSVFAQGQGLFGPFFALIYFSICMALFYLMQLLLVRLSSGNTILAAPAMLLIWNFFIAGITGESIHQMVGFVLRNLLQAIVIYLIVYQSCRLFTRSAVIEQSVEA